ncbi:MAG: hypothetical protein ACE5JL_15405 [Dehalococcoidia bacterium]
MTFDEILAQVIDLLKRQGRVSYRALKLRFDLDDEYLDTLKEEILFAYPQVVDEGSRGFVWTGETEGTQPTPSPFDTKANPNFTTVYRTRPRTTLLHAATPCRENPDFS